MEESPKNDQSGDEQNEEQNNEIPYNQKPRPADSKREEFRKYLEKSGVLDSLTKVLVTLYEEPEKPSSAVERFLKQHIGGGPPETADVESMKLEMKKLSEKNKELENEVAELKQKLEHLETGGKSEEEKSG